MVFVYGGSFAVTAVLAVGVGGVATVGVFCDCFRLLAAVNCPGIDVRRESGLLLLAFALSSCFALLSSRGGVMSAGVRCHCLPAGCVW